MTNMFKKSLIALAIAGVGTSAMAADLATGTTTKVVSTEYVGLAPASTIEASNVILALGAEYAVNDVISLTFSGTSLKVASLPSSVSVAAVPESGAGLNDGTKGLTLGLISTSVVDGNTVANYRVTAIEEATGTPTTVGVNLDFLTPDFDSTKLGSGVEVSFSAQTNGGLALDTSGGDDRSEDLFEIKDQFAIAVGTKLDAVIDAENDRVVFTGPATDDVATFTSSQVAGFGAEVATVADVNYVVNGNFSWVEDSNTGTAGVQPETGTFVLSGAGATGCAVSSVTSTALTISDCDALGVVTVTIDTAPQGGDVILPAGSFTLDTNVEYTVAAATGSTDLANQAAGEWTINASETFIPYMPYSRDDLSAISQIIYVTNSGKESGEISVDAVAADGTTYNLSNADLGGITAAPGVTKLTGAIVDALTAKGALTGGSTTKQFSLNVVVNDADTAISVYSAYNVNGSDRGWVQNDSVRTFN